MQQSPAARASSAAAPLQKLLGGAIKPVLLRSRHHGPWARARRSAATAPAHLGGLALVLHGCRVTHHLCCFLLTKAGGKRAKFGRARVLDSGQAAAREEAAGGRRALRGGLTVGARVRWPNLSESCCGGILGAGMTAVLVSAATPCTACSAVPLAEARAAQRTRNAAGSPHLRPAHSRRNTGSAWLWGVLWGIADHCAPYASVLQTCAVSGAIASGARSQALAAALPLRNSYTSHSLSTCRIEPPRSTLSLSRALDDKWPHSCSTGRAPRPLASVYSQSTRSLHRVLPAS